MGWENTPNKIKFGVFSDCCWMQRCRKCRFTANSALFASWCSYQIKEPANSSGSRYNTFKQEAGLRPSHRARARHILHHCMELLENIWPTTNHMTVLTCWREQCAGMNQSQMQCSVVNVFLHSGLPALASHCFPNWQEKLHNLYFTKRKKKKL